MLQRGPQQFSPTCQLSCLYRMAPCQCVKEHCRNCIVRTFSRAGIAFNRLSLTFSVSLFDTPLASLLNLYIRLTQPCHLFLSTYGQFLFLSNQDIQLFKLVINYNAIKSTYSRTFSRSTMQRSHHFSFASHFIHASLNENLSPEISCYRGRNANICSISQSPTPIPRGN